MRASRTVLALVVLGLVSSLGASSMVSPGDATQGGSAPGQAIAVFGGDNRSPDGALLASDAAHGDADAGGMRALVSEWTTNLSMVTTGSPRLCDIDGDGVDEIILTTMGVLGNPYGSGRVYVFNRSGASLPGWPVTTTSPFPSSAAVADLDHNGDMEIIAESWANVHVWNHDGTAFPGWPKYHGTGYTVAPAVADLDDDGDLEIICATGTKMYVWHHNGAALPGWPFTAPKPIAPAAVADVDGDGVPEIIAGTWEGPYPGSPPFPFYVWKVDGTLAPGFPIVPPGQTRGPVSLGDLDNDGDVEMVARINDLIYVWNAQGQVQPGWPVDPSDAIRNSATALGDLDGDGDLEIVIAGYMLQAFHHNGTAVAGFPAAVPPGTGNIVSGPIIADIDGDAPQREIVVHSANTFHAVHADGTVVADFPYTLSDDGNSATFSSSPAVGDLDANHQVEYVFVSLSGRVAYFDEPHAHWQRFADWPVFEHDPRNTCYLAGLRAGDVNCDGLVDFGDINPFVLALSNPAAYGQAYPDCDIMNGDMNCDGAVDFGDINPFVACLATGDCDCP